MLLSVLRAGLRPYRHWLAVVVALQFVGTMASLLLPSLNADIIDNGVARGDTGYIVRTGVVMLGIAVVQIVCSVGAVYFGARSAMAFGRDTRRDLFARVGSFSQREVDLFGAPSLITRSTNDVQQVQMLVVLGATLMVTAPIMMVGGVLMAMRQDLGLSRLLLVVVPLLFVTIGLIVSRMVPGFREMQGRIDTVNAVLREQITGVRVVRAFVREPVEAARFGEANADLTRVAVRVGRWMAAMFPAMLLIVNLAGVAVIWFGGQRIGDGLGVGALTAFLAYLMQILMAVMMSTFMLAMVPRASVCADRIGEVLATHTSVVPPPWPVPPGTVRGVVELDAATFSYPGADQPVLRGVSLRATPGTTTAVVGSTGAGKSTLVGLVPRLYDVTGGAVRLDGHDVRELDPEAVWGAMGLVPQQAFLFSGTVASNLRLADPEATDADLWAALEVAQARDFVEAMPERLDAPITQGGTNVSGGQRQRLAIARAVVKRPRVYLFDDAFSALDVATDARLRAALRPVVADATVIVVAQRVSTIRDADRIVVLEDGAVVGVGTHDELLVSCATYQEIVTSQQPAEVVA